jgi:hypothetical protein
MSAFRGEGGASGVITWGPILLERERVFLGLALFRARDIHAEE